jgi:hypothetical protein
VVDSHRSEKPRIKIAAADLPNRSAGEAKITSRAAQAEKLRCNGKIGQWIWSIGGGYIVGYVAGPIELG